MEKKERGFCLFIFRLCLFHMPRDTGRPHSARCRRHWRESFPHHDVGVFRTTTRIPIILPSSSQRLRPFSFPRLDCRPPRVIPKTTASLKLGCRARHACFTSRLAAAQCLSSPPPVAGVAGGSAGGTRYAVHVSSAGGLGVAVGSGRTRQSRCTGMVSEATRKWDNNRRAVGL